MPSSTTPAGWSSSCGTVCGRCVVIVANDNTVSAGAWWPHTPEKIQRAQKLALRMRIPVERRTAYANRRRLRHGNAITQKRHVSPARHTVPKHRGKLNHSRPVEPGLHLKYRPSPAPTRKRLTLCRQIKTRTFHEINHRNPHSKR